VNCRGDEPPLTVVEVSSGGVDMIGAFHDRVSEGELTYRVSLGVSRRVDSRASGET